MSPPTLSETKIDEDLKYEIAALSRTFSSVEEAEARALRGEISAPLCNSRHWKKFREAIRVAINQRGYVVVRGLDADEGRSLLIASAALGETFDAYKPGHIVKRFRMSPWTSELSHTTRAGDFHTDGNVSTVPPVATAMQCEREDPGAPEYAEQRVAHLPDLLERLITGDAESINAHVFLTENVTAMAHERSQELWQGQLVKDRKIRYHPHSLRVAAKRLDQDGKDVEAIIATIHRAAMDVSVPFHTAPGDTVFVSNQAALHYRGACSVRFIRFPMEFDARSLFVLHLVNSGAHA